MVRDDKFLATLSSLRLLLDLRFARKGRKLLHKGGSWA